MNKFLNKKSSRGFTLVEMLIYLAILVVVSILVVGSVVMMMRAFNRIRVARMVDDSAKLVMERLVNEIRYATSTDTGAGQSSFDSHPGKLVINTADRVTENPTAIEFSLSGSTLRIKEGAQAYQDLTPPNIEITNLVFRRIALPSAEEAVKIEMTIKGTRGTYEKIGNFYDTVVLRGSY